MVIRKAKRMSLVTKHTLVGYVFLTPFTIGCLLFFISPLILYISMSFNQISMNNEGLVFKYAGLTYYNIFLLQDTKYISEVLISLQNIFITLPAIIIYSFFIAVVLNQKFKGRTFFRSVFFLPVIIASGVQVLANADPIAQSAISAVSGTQWASTDDTLNLGGIVLNLLGSNYINIVNQYIQPIINNIYTVTLSSGVQILIYLAALQTVPSSVYEAANIDGATAWESFWKITLPYLSPMILVNTVYTLIDLLGNQNNVVVQDIYNQITVNTKFSLGAGMGTVYFAIIFALMGLIIFVLSKAVYYEDR